MRRMAEERGLPFRLDAALFPCRDGCRAPLDHRVAPDVAVALELADEALLRRTVDYFRKMRGTPPEDRLFSGAAGLTGFHVDPEGTLLPCLMASTHGFDLRQGSFREGWETVLPGFREQVVEPGLPVPRVREALPVRPLPRAGRHGDGKPAAQGRVPVRARRGALARHRAAP